MLAYLRSTLSLHVYPTAQPLLAGRLQSQGLILSLLPQDLCDIPLKQSVSASTEQAHVIRLTR